MKMTTTFSKMAALINGMSGRFRTVWDRMSRALTVSLLDGVITPQKVIALSLQKHELVLVQGSKFLGRIRLARTERVPLRGDTFMSPDQVADAVEYILSSWKIKKSDAVFIVPTEWLILRTVEFPSTVREYLDTVVPNEFDRITPFPPGEALYDYRVSPGDGEKLKINIVAAKKDVIMPYITALTEKGLRIQRATSAVSALAMVTDYLGEKNDTLVVSLQKNGYEGCLLTQGAISSVFGGELVSSDDDTRDEGLAGDLGPVIEDCQGKGMLLSVQVFLNGPGSTGLEQKLLVPVTLFHDAWIQKAFRTKLGNIAVPAVGGILELLQGKAGGYNLLGRGEKTARKVPIGATIVLACVLAGMFVPLAVMPLEMEKRRLAEIERQIAARKDDVRKAEILRKDVEGLAAELNQIRDFKESRPTMMMVMKELTTILPKSVWLTRSRVTEETVEIEGYAQSATEILPKLEQSTLFKKAEFLSPTIRDTRQNADRFLIRLEIEGYEKKESGKTKDEKKK